MVVEALWFAVVVAQDEEVRVVDEAVAVDEVVQVEDGSDRDANEAVLVDASVLVVGEDNHVCDYLSCST